jgi:hypothetical protein
MFSKKKKSETLTEEELTSLLSGLKIDASPEADFESRFLHDFRERVAADAVTKSARSLLWDHIKMMFSNMGKQKLAFGATSLCACGFAIGFLTWPSDDEPTTYGNVENSGSAAVAVNPEPATTFVKDNGKDELFNRPFVEPLHGDIYRGSSSSSDFAPGKRIVPVSAPSYTLKGYTDND